MDDILTRYHTEIENELQHILDNPNLQDPIITPIVSEYVFRGGKRLRPKMTVITAEMIADIIGEFKSIKAIIVFFHTCSFLLARALACTYS